MEKEIISFQNLKIKNIIKLRKSKERKKQDLIIIEGEKEIDIAIASRAKIVELFFCKDFKKKNISNNFKNITYVSKDVFKKISYRENPDGFLAIAKPNYLELNDFKLNKNSLILILEEIEKPGNLGAIIRTADASGVDGIIINDSKTDIFNPNIIRASRGTIFSKKIIVSSFDETKEWLKKNKIKSLATSLSAKKKYTEINYKEPTAIIFGSEDKGLSQRWVDNADELIKIPMAGKIDSLNVSVSVAVIVFEAVRQRGKNI